MKKRWIIVAVCIVLVMAIAATVLFLMNAGKKYKEEDILGKDVATIVGKYGEFDRVQHDESGETIKSGWYIIDEKQSIFFGDRNIRYLVIQFKEGIAVKTYERVGIPGG